MATSTQEAPAAAETKPPFRRKERIRRRGAGRIDETGTRFFLVKASSAEKIELGEDDVAQELARTSSVRNGRTNALRHRLPGKPIALGNSFR